MKVQKRTLADSIPAPRGATSLNGGPMTTTLQHLRELKQSLWLDSISRPMLDDGRIQRYVTELGVTGLTSNPTIFDEAIGTGAYDEDIARKARAGKSGEALFTELALDDLRRAAALFRPAFDATGGVDG